MSRRQKIEDRLQIDPDDVFLNYSYAMELAKLGEEPAARAAYLRVRELDPNYVPGYFQEGQFLAGVGDLENARTVLQAGITVARRIGDSHAVGEMTEFLQGLD